MRSLSRLPGPLMKSPIITPIALLALLTLAACQDETPPPEQSESRPALTVELARPETANWVRSLSANGNVAAWQEAVIGAEVAGYRIAEVLVDVGAQVRKGQVLARIDASTMASEVAEARAAVAELEASVAEARANAKRAEELQARGFYSQQMKTQYQTAEQGAAARLAAARARLQAAELRLGRTNVQAPDDGVISGRAATVGSLTQAGQELFRLIRGGRLEWRAEVPSADLAALRPGMPAQLTGPGGETVPGRVRSVAPSVNPESRNGIVYVDLEPSPAVRAGMFARGEFQLGEATALTVPASALVLRDGFTYLFRLEGEDRVALTKVTPGRRQGERVEIIEGLPEGAAIVAAGAGFLADNDRVRLAPGKTTAAGPTP